MKRLAVLLAALLTFVLGARPVWAHAAPHSVVLLDLRTTDARVELRLPVTELEAALDRPLAAEQAAVVEREGAAIGALVMQGLHAESLAGEAWIVSLGDLGYDVEDPIAVVVVTATLTPPQPVRAGVLPPFRLVDEIISAKVPNHRSWIGVRSDFDRGFVSGSPSLVGVADQMHPAVLVDRGATTSGNVGAFRGFRSIFRLGVRHIAEGTDHLLFLLVLLLPAPLLVTRNARQRLRWSDPRGARASFLQLLRVVSAFTVGHSITLLGGTVGWLRLPSAPVETLIAVSVLVSAVHAVRPLFPGREAWIAGAFGLVHGLAFASALGELHLDGPRLVLALLGFNLGIEAMQLMVVAASFPWLLLLARTRAYRFVRVGGALFAGAAAVGWIGQRALGLSDPLDALVAALVTHWALVLAALVVGALAGTFGPSRWRQPVASVTSARVPGRQVPLALGVLALSCAPTTAGTVAVAPTPPHPVELANAFLGTLDAAQRGRVSYAFGDDQQRARWSNFPTPVVPRGGVSLHDLTDPQRKAAFALLASVLSARGFEKAQEIMGADDAFKAMDHGPAGHGGPHEPGGPGGPPGGPAGDHRGPPPGGGGAMFGSDLYFLSILGTPSEHEPWMLQFGGHHLALNLTLVGDQEVLTPSLTGAQPATYQAHGETIRPLGRENDRGFALMSALHDTQRKQAILPLAVHDLVLGPGRDGQTVPPEGLRVSTMNPAQKAKLMAVVSEWVGIVDERPAQARLDEIEAGLDETWFAWSGPTSVEAGKNGAAYYRIQGPRLFIEYAPQGDGSRDDPADHVHTIYRDPTDDYGRQLTKR